MHRFPSKLPRLVSTFTPAEQHAYRRLVFAQQQIEAFAKSRTVTPLSPVTSAVVLATLLWQGASAAACFYCAVAATAAIVAIDVYVLRPWLLRRFLHALKTARPKEPRSAPTLVQQIFVRSVQPDVLAVRALLRWAQEDLDHRQEDLDHRLVAAAENIELSVDGEDLETAAPANTIRLFNLSRRIGIEATFGPREASMTLSHRDLEVFELTERIYLDANATSLSYREFAVGLEDLCQAVRNLLRGVSPEEHLSSLRHVAELVESSRGDPEQLLTVLQLATQALRSSALITYAKPITIIRQRLAEAARAASHVFAVSSSTPQR